MYLRIDPTSYLKPVTSVPASKPETQRAILTATLAGGRSRIRHSCGFAREIDGCERRACRIRADLLRPCGYDNNASYAASYFNNKHNLPELTEIPDYDWVSFARTFSIPGVRVSNLMELSDRMPEIMNRSTPFLLEIRCGHTFSTPNAAFAARMKSYPGL
jgi:hypothetical protein